MMAKRLGAPSIGIEVGDSPDDIRESDAENGRDRSEKEALMHGHNLRLIAVPLGILAACALIAAGCGDDDDESTTTTTGTVEASAQKSVDAAVKSCTDAAQELGEAARSGLEAACTTVGDNAEQALSSAGDQTDEALAQAADDCRTTVSQLPEGEAQAALTDLCGAIEK
jgi:hypothetical protein